MVYTLNLSKAVFYPKKVGVVKIKVPCWTKSQPTIFLGAGPWRDFQAKEL